MSQKAAVFAKKHDYPVVQERPIPTPGNDQLLVKVEAVGLNPVEWKIIDYELFRDPPQILGYDAAGVVEKVGPNVTDYKKGDRIFSMATRNTDDESAHQQYALFGTAPQYTVKIPENISFDEASTLPTALNTAQVALYDPSGFGFPNPFTGGNKFGKGKAIFVAGGSSVIGLAAIQLARLSGFSKIIATSSKAHQSLLKEFGATDVIDRNSPIDAQVEQIHSIAPSIQYVWDAIGSKDTNTLSARAIGAEGGLIVSSLPVDEGVLKEFKNVEGRDIVGSPSLHTETASKFWPHVEEALRKGDLLPIPHKVAPGGLAGVAKALQSVKKASGYKVVVHPQE